MNHRIKNILAAVQAIANQTFKDRATADSLRAFGSRLTAMAAAHDLLVSENWESADLHADGDGGAGAVRHRPRARFALEGPPMQITAKAALALSMALHELCTNAAKYGALSTRPARSRCAGASPPARPAPASTSPGPRAAARRSRARATGLRHPPDPGGAGERARRHRRPRVRRDGLRFTVDADAATVLADQTPAQGTAA